MSSRLGLAQDAGALPGSGSILLVGPPAELDLAPFGEADLTILHDMMPDAARWTERGFAVVQSFPEGPFGAAVVFVPRSREAARDRIARAAEVAARVLVDGQKTDGVDGLLKEVRRAVPLHDTLSKSHGKLFWFEPAPGALENWQAEPRVLEGGWQVAPGVFSADGVDPGSAMLADALPPRLAGRVADLGAGWGYLSARALERCTGIEELHLVEAQAAALDCARRNVDDPRSRFHWADATEWTGAADIDAVIMNPPFHTGRTTDIGLGRAFIAAAARLLRPGGTLWMVANRHLPYEQVLRSHLDDVTELGGDNRYKLMRGVALPRKRR